jgi:4-hydroxy-4-methyl-2-oxoglutarate aldolase
MNIVERLASCYTSAVHDVMREFGYDRFVLPHNILPLKTDTKLCGEIWTFSGYVDRRLSADETYLRWTSVLAKAPAGRILVCQPQTDEFAVMGELSAQALKMRGVVGYVADGGCRDVETIRSIGFPVFCTFRTPKDIVGRWVPDRWGLPITIGEVSLRTGDYLLADTDGIVVISPERIEELVARAEQIMSTEGDVRRAILSGMDAHSAYLKHRKF